MCDEQANSWQTVLPMYAADPARRALALRTTPQGFLYGPASVGNTFNPAGLLGNASVTSYFNPLSANAASTAVVSTSDVAMAAAAVQKVSVEHMSVSSANSVRLVESTTYRTTLYYTMANGSNQFPEGVDSGILTNYTSDLLFSIERLSLNPYNIVRLNPKASQLPFQVDAEVVQNLAGVSLDTLFATGSLFYIDYSSQSAYPKTEMSMAY